MGVNKESVKKILEAIGGEENINRASHCVTRLRLVLKDEDKVNKEELEKLDLVKGSFSSNGQFQIVIGQGTVDKVYKVLMDITGMEESSKSDVKEEAAQNLNPLQRAIKVLADIFIPILPAIVTAGILMGLNSILTSPGIFGEKSVIQMYPQWKGFTQIVNLIANTAFTFLPGLIGWSAVKRFGGSPLFGIVMGLILVHPNLLNAWTYGSAIQEGDVPTWNLFGLQVEKIGYQGQVLPVLFASYILAKIEIWLRNRVHDSIQMLVVAPTALLITGFLTFIVIGPITFAIGNGITSGIVAIFEAFPALGGFIYGAIYAPMVVTGMHHTFLAVDLQLLASTNSTFLWPILALSNIAQGSAAFAIMLATRNEKLKGLSGSAGLSAYLGITEPAMFGVNLRFKYPFLMALIGSSIAGGFITFMDVLATSIGIGGIPAFFSIFASDWGPFFIGMAISIVIPFILTFGYTKVKKDV